MSRPKFAKAKARSSDVSLKSKASVESTPAAKSASPESTPDRKGSKDDFTEPPKQSPVEEKPWSEWLWNEDGQMCYRGRKDSKGEWEYDFAPLPKGPKESPYTASKIEPIEYLIEELKIIWAPVLVPNSPSVAVTPASTIEPLKGAEEIAQKKSVVVSEQTPADSEEDEIKTPNEDEDEMASQTSASEKKSEHTTPFDGFRLNRSVDKSEKLKRDKSSIKRGRRLERPERRHLNHKERKEKVEGWQMALER